MGKLKGEGDEQREVKEKKKTRGHCSILFVGSGGQMITENAKCGYQFSFAGGAE